MSNFTQFIPTKTNVQIFSAAGSSTWTKPVGALFVMVEVWGAGGGGGSGAKGNSTSITGGTGGAGGAYTQRLFNASELPSTVSVVVGAGGNGGAAQTTAGSNGNNGTAGGASKFGAYLTAYGGGLGYLGSTATGTPSIGGGVLSAAGEPLTYATTGSTFYQAGQFNGAIASLTPATNYLYNQNSAWGGAAGAPSIFGTVITNAGGASFQGGSGGGAGSAVSTSNTTYGSASSGGSWIYIPAYGASNSVGGGGAVGGGAGTSAYLRGGGGGGNSIVTPVPAGFISYGAGRLAVTNAGSTYTSTDNGSTWTVSRSTPSAGGATQTNGCQHFYDGSQWVCGDSTGNVWVSSDFATWTRKGQVPFYANTATEQIRKYVVANGKYFALGNLGTIFVSTDLISWSIGSSGGSGFINDLAWSGSYYVAVGVNVIARSSDSTTWAVVDSTARTNSVVASNGAGKVVVGANTTQGTYISSDNGATWANTVTATATSGTFLSCALTYLNSQWQYINQSLVSYTSSDGTNWSTTGANVPAIISSLTYTGTYWFAVARSTNAIYTAISLTSGWGTTNPTAPVFSGPGGAGGLASGGGGGGAGSATVDSGAGGKGGDGLIRVYAW